MKKRNKQIVTKTLAICMASSMALGNLSVAHGASGINTSYGVQTGSEILGVQTDLESENMNGSDANGNSLANQGDSGSDSLNANGQDVQGADNAGLSGESEAVPPTEGISAYQMQVPVDGMWDTWENAGDVAAATNEVYGDSWLHIVSSAENANEQDSCYFVSKEASQITDGTVKATLYAGSALANTRAGLMLRFKPADNAGEKSKGVFVGYDPTGVWFYQVYNGTNNPYAASGKAGLDAGKSAELEVTLKDNKMSAAVDGETIFTDIDISTAPAQGEVALKVASYGSAASNMYFQNISYPGQRTEVYGTVSGTVVEKGTTDPIANAKVTVAGKTVKTTTGGAFTIPLADSDEAYPLTVQKGNYKTYTNQVEMKDKKDVTLKIELEKVSVTTKKLASEVMEVTVDENFPRVISYQMKDKNGVANGKVFQGQANYLDTITINGVDLVPTITSEAKSSGSGVVYTITAKDEANNIDAVLTAEIVVVKNTLEFNITKIEDNKMVKTIEIKNHNLVSVNSSQTGAVLDGSNMSVNTHVNGDRKVTVDDKLDVNEEAEKGYMYAFVSNNDFSAGLWSNSENKVSADWQRVTARASENDDGVKSIGLSSTYWTYQKDEGYRKEDGTIEYKDSSKGDAIAADELPSVKVAIAGDLNGDGNVDWNDGAIAYRDIMNNPVGAEKVPDLVAYRIAMNFGSQAQNPFLMTLDNLKKVSLNTDGLGQSILLKGYGSEGHDSGHLNYADIGQRIGGAEDMKTLMEEGAKYGATFGIHVNASETYPESQYFSEDILMKKEDGSFSYGWNWIDQGININADYDLRNGRVDRWKDLYDILGGKNNKLDFIYVDVWGNGQSGDNGTWPSRQLAKEITGLGWRLAGEWGFANEYDSTFQHWAADLTYGDYNSKGVNSTIARFIRNHQKDSWVGNYASYGGEAEAPLLGGYSMKDFEGWQGRSDYAAYIKNLYEVDVASKYVQHFTVSKWVEGTPVTMESEGKYEYVPGMEADLDGEAGKLKITRNSNDYAGDIEGYRTRTMTLDGTKIFEGREGSTEYMIPWAWDSNGQKLDAAAQKLYYWNSTGKAAANWTAANGWKSCSVDVYELTDLGKEKVGTASIDSSGTIDLSKLELKQSTPYVLYGSGTTDPMKDMTWSEGMHIVDSGFNSGSLKSWTIKGAKEGSGVAIEKSQGSNPMLTFTNTDGTVSVSQKLTGLKPNTKYAAYVGVDSRSSAKASMQVSANGTKTETISGRSVAKNYVSAYAHNTSQAVATVDDTSYFQNMYVFFETGANADNVTLTISREAGKGATYFDDIRICENNSSNWEKWNSEKVFTQDFEDVAQGIYPFVVGGLEGVTDNRTHLSELHAPYTQRGWNQKVVNDVIEGGWSVKTNGLTQRDNILYQTIPQNFTFEPGKSYVISFDYEAGSDGTYAFIKGVGEGKIQVSKKLKSTASNDPKAAAGHYVYSFTVPEKAEDTWIGIYSTDEAADTQGVTGAQVDFNGYNDFMLDNLVIMESESDKSKLVDLLDEAESLVEEIYTADSWKAMMTEVKNAYKVLEEKTTQAQVDAAAAKLEKVIKSLKKVKVTDSILKSLIDRCGAYQEKDYTEDGWLAYVVHYNYAKDVLAEINAKSTSQEMLQAAYQDLIYAEIQLQKNRGESMAGDDREIGVSNYTVDAGSHQSGEGPENASDNNPDTLWHTSWEGAAEEDRWFEMTFNKPEEVAGFNYLPRQSGKNGFIKDYEIEISTDGGKTYTQAAKGTWTTDDVSWKTVEFASSYKGVTNLRLKSLTSYGDSDGFASAAEIRALGVKRDNQDAPKGLKSTVASKGKSDGTITGVTAAMEYSASPTGKYQTCKGAEISDLAVSNYFVRFAETEALKKSIPVKVAVFDSFTAVGGSIDGGSGSSGSGGQDAKDETTNTTTTTDTKEDENSKVVTTVTTTVSGDKTTVVTKIENTDKKTGAVTVTTVTKVTGNDNSVSVDIAQKGENADCAVTGVKDASGNVTKLETTVSLKTGDVSVVKKKAEIGVAVSKESLEQLVSLVNDADSSMLKAQPMAVTVTIPASMVKEQLSQKKVNSVLVVLDVPKDTKNYEVRSVILPKAALKAAKSNQKTVQIKVREDGSKTLATWSFTKAALKKSSSISGDINLAVTVSQADKGSKTLENIFSKDSKNKAESSVSVSLAHGKELPAEATVTVPVGNLKGATAGTKVYLYVVNAKTGKLEEVPNAAYKVTKNGNVALNVIHGTEYVLVTKKPSANVVTPITAQVKVKKTASLTGIGEKIKLDAALPCTLNKVSKFSKDTGKKAIAEVKISYKSGNKKIASVTNKGTVTGKKKGKTTITTIFVFADGRTKSVKTTITVK